MSRAYRITIEESLRHHAQAEDGVISQLELLPILSAARTSELLAQELVQRGFQVDGDCATRREADETVIEVQLSDGKVKVSARETQALELKVKKTAVLQQPSSEADMRKTAQEALAVQAKEEEQKLKERVTERLTQRLKDLRGELDQVVNRVTAGSLKERAGQLGTIEEMTENAETGELTIKVRV